MGYGTDMTNDKIIEGLKSNSSEVLNFIYQNYYPVIEEIILYKYYGNKDDAKDIFQDGLLTAYSALMADPPLILQYKFITFLIAVCKRRMIDKIRTTKKKLIIDEHIEIESDTNIIDYITNEDRKRLIEKHFSQLGEKCKALLRLFLEGHSITEVTLELDMSSEKFTKNKRLRCKKELFKKIYNDPLLKELSDGKPWTIREIPRW